MTGQPAAPRAHGTRARYVLGAGPGKTPGCRCLPCTRANRAAENRRQRLQAYGQWKPYVDAAPAREHMATLSAAGMGWRHVAQLAGVAQGAMSKLLYGGPGTRPPSRRLRAETERKILAVRPGRDLLRAGARTGAAGTRRRIQALVAAGYSQAFLAARLGRLPSNFHLTECEQVTAGTASAVRTLYDELWDVPPNESGHRQKISVSRARNYARERGWVPPMAWDDDAIDNPAAAPAEGWQRAERLSPADVVAEATELIAWEGSRKLAAARLGITPGTLNTALSRARRAS